MPTVALIHPGDIAQEIQARSIGVSAVLTDETEDNLFMETVANILSLTTNDG